MGLSEDAMQPQRKKTVRRTIFLILPPFIFLTVVWTRHVSLVFPVSAPGFYFE
jgi:hypothetical protein